MVGKFPDRDDGVLTGLCWLISHLFRKYAKKEQRLNPLWNCFIESRNKKSHTA